MTFLKTIFIHIIKQTILFVSIHNNIFLKTILSYKTQNNVLWNFLISLKIMLLANYFFKEFIIYSQRHHIFD